MRISTWPRSVVVFVHEKSVCSGREEERSHFDQPHKEQAASRQQPAAAASSVPKLPNRAWVRILDSGCTSLN